MKEIQSKTKRVKLDEDTTKEDDDLDNIMC